MPEENTKQIHTTALIAVILLVVYGIISMIFGVYTFLVYVFNFEGFDILSLPVTIAFTLIYVSIPLMLFNAAKQLIDGKKTGASMGMGGVLIIAVPGSLAMLEYVYVEDDLILIPVVWLIYNIFLFSFLKKSKKILNR